MAASSSKPASKAVKTATAGRRRRTQVRMTVFSLVLLTMMMVALPTVVVLVVGFLPTLTWFIVDMTPGRYAFRCIAGFNAAGVAPYALKLWTGGNDMAAAIGIVADPLAWMVFLCASAFGWMMFQVIPAGVTMVMTLDAKRRINAFQDVQKNLVEEWGPAVAGEHAETGPADAEAQEGEEVPAI